MRINLKTIFRVLFGISMVLFMIGGNAYSQNQTGVIKGRVTNNLGAPVEKAMIYIDSPELMAIPIYISPSSGRFLFDFLPPGMYSLLVELPEYKTAEVKNINLYIGQTVHIDVILTPAEEGETEILRIPSPLLNPKSHKKVEIIEEAVFESLPFKQNDLSILLTATGFIPSSKENFRASVISGSPVRSNLYSVDGIDMNEPSVKQSFNLVPFNSVKQVEIEGTGHSPATGMGDGGYVNIITKNGGNKFNYTFLIQHSNDELTSLLRTQENIDKWGVQSPERDRRLWNTGLNFSGPLWIDRAWFFSSINWNNSLHSTPFIPWKDGQGNSYDKYDGKIDQKNAFIKLSLLPYSRFYMNASFYYINQYNSNTSPSSEWNLASNATRVLDHGKYYNFNGTIRFTINQNSNFRLNLGYLSGNTPFRLQNASLSEPGYSDAVTGYRWGSGLFNDRLKESRFYTRALLTKYFNFGNAVEGVFRFGGEYKYNEGKRIAWKENNLQIHYWNNNPYFYGLQSSPSTGALVGTGKISLNFASGTENEYFSLHEIRRIGLFLSSSLTLADRITLNAGIRFDRSMGNLPAYPKYAIGSDVGIKIGDDLIEPIIGTNPYLGISVPLKKNLIVWNSFSPRAGIVIDLFGNHKTLLQGSFSRYAEYPSLELLFALNVFSPDRSHNYYWYDENKNREVDTDDSFALFPDDYFLYEETIHDEWYKGEKTAPYTDEISAGIEQEITNELSLKINLIQKNRNNILGSVLYDRNNSSYWYTKDLDTNDYWIPFDTIVPGSGDFQDTPVTVYFPSKEAPLYYDRIKNVPELKAKYRSIEFILNKKMGNNWMFNGSIVLNESKGNVSPEYYRAAGMVGQLISPNYFINFGEDSRMEFDRPLAVKALGLYKFPLDFMMSFYYRHLSGSLWTRSVTIVPPQDWAQTNQIRSDYATVLLEEPGQRRLKSTNFLDLRLQKTFALSSQRNLSFSIDVMNVLGEKSNLEIENDKGYWFPDQENSVLGTKVISPYFNQIKILRGSRTFRFNLRFGF